MSNLKVEPWIFSVSISVLHWSFLMSSGQETCFSQTWIECLNKTSNTTQQDCDFRHPSSKFYYFSFANKTLNSTEKRFDFYLRKKRKYHYYTIIIPCFKAIYFGILIIEKKLHVTTIIIIIIQINKINKL